MHKINLGLLLFLFLRTSAQLDNSALLFNSQIDTTTEKGVYVKIQNLNYFKDNEYSGPIANGYTLLGNQLNSQIGFRFSKNIELEGGIFLNKDFGNDQLTKILPTFTFRYQKNNFKFLFGNIDGSLNHNLVEPLYNFENVISKRLENGIQFICNEKHFDFDLWLDWLKASYYTSNSQEKLNVGLSANVFKFKTEKMEFKIPFQGLVYHTGGQMDTLALGSVTHWNYSSGIILSFFLKNNFLKTIKIDARYLAHERFHYKLNNTKYNFGSGLLANLEFQFKSDWNLQFSYWYGDNFYSDYGGYLYSSKSSIPIYSYYSERYRELFFVRVSKKMKVFENINALVRLEPYYDMRSKWMEYAAGLYISIDEKFWLKK